MEKLQLVKINGLKGVEIYKKVEVNESTDLIKFDYTKPNYEAIVEELNWNEVAVPRLEVMAKEPRHEGQKPCVFCNKMINAWIYEDEEMNRLYQPLCEICDAEQRAEKIDLEITINNPRFNGSYYQRSKPIRILSWGVGKDSTALILKYGDIVDEIIFCDTGAEELETYEYLKYFLQKLPSNIRNKITVIKNAELGKIDDWHFGQKMIPMPFANRQCTDKFKLRVIHKYVRKVYGIHAVFDMMVGINYDEALERERPLATDKQLNHYLFEGCRYTQQDLEKLAKRMGVTVEDYKERVRTQMQTGAYIVHKCTKCDKEVHSSIHKKCPKFDKQDAPAISMHISKGGCQYARNVYPLCDEKIGKDAEMEIYKEYGYEVPPKSGCYFCPMKSKSEWEKTENQNDARYENTLRIQEHSTSRLNILTMSKEKESEMRCSCSNGLYDASEEEAEDELAYAVSNTGRGM